MIPWVLGLSPHPRIPLCFCGESHSWIVLFFFLSVILKLFLLILSKIILFFTYFLYSMVGGGSKTRGTFEVKGQFVEFCSLLPPWGPWVMTFLNSGCQKWKQVHLITELYYRSKMSWECKYNFVPSVILGTNNSPQIFLVLTYETAGVS